MKKIKIMEWNINQRGGKSDYIPMWIVDEFDESDIVILTEYCNRNSNSSDFIQKINGKGYNSFYSENSKGNDVLIAVKKCFPIMDGAKFVPCGGIDDIPENLRIDIKVEDKILSVIGVRIKEFGAEIRDKQKRKQKITDEDYQRQALARAKNMAWFIQWVKEIQNPIIVAGDFNNYRRGTPVQEWNLEELDKAISSYFVRKTPTGQSIYQEKAEDLEHEFAEDHFLVKNVQLENPLYCRGFCRRDKDIYQWEKDFQYVYYRYRKRYTEKITEGYPDHAILRGEISFPLTTLSR